jgi:FkbM family methyltransferase
MYLDTYENRNYDIESNGEARVVACLDSPRVMIDVGANTGQWSMTAARHHPDARIYAFEVMSQIRARLSRNVSGIRNVYVVPFGLLDKDDEVPGRRFIEESGWSTVLRHDVQQAGSWAATHENSQFVDEVCQVKRGDAFLSDNGIKRVSMLKIDVEGAEHLVLKGFNETLSAGRVDVVQFEYGYVSTLTRFLLRDFYELFEPLGYSIGKVYPRSVSFRPYAVEDEDFIGPNFVAVRNDLQPLIERLSR